MSRVTKFGSALRELRIHLCQQSESSKGVREFIKKIYVPMKQANPKFPILIRECKGVQPKLWARYDMGKEKSVSLKDMDSNQITAEVEKLACKS